MSLTSIINNIESAAADAYSTVSKSLSQAEAAKTALIKSMNKATIQYVLAPMKKGELKDIKWYFDQLVKEISEEAKNNLTEISSSLDDSIKGKFSTAIQTKVTDTASKYDDI